MALVVGKEWELVKIASLQELPHATLTLALKAMLIHRDCYTAYLRVRLHNITLFRLKATETKRCNLLAQFLNWSEYWLACHITKSIICVKFIIKN